MEKEIEESEDLTREAMKKGTCCEFNGCNFPSSAAELDGMEMGGNETFRLVNEEQYLKCGTCCLICPPTYVLNTRIEFGLGPSIEENQRMNNLPLSIRGAR